MASRGTPDQSGGLPDDEKLRRNPRGFRLDRQCGSIYEELARPTSGFIPPRKKRS
ncbi:hypothetical protein [Azospirillum palustre]